MSRQRALEIYTESGFSNPQWAVDIIERATTLDDLAQIMREDKTYLGATQFVNFRISALYKGDSDFAERTMANAMERFSQLGLPEEVIEYYISKGGSVDIRIATRTWIQLGKLPVVENKERISDFFEAADQYLFETLREYVTKS